jgi:deoxycytidylate deaminase
VKQSIGVLACLACWSTFTGCTSQPPPIPKATVQVGQSGRCGTTHGVFVETGRMHTPRALHTATLLEDGTVLIAGGIAGRPSAALDSSEIFDPASGTFLSSGTMTTARQQAVATRLPDGRVLIAGGYAKGIGTIDLYLAAIVAGDSNSPVDNAEIYDPRTKSFTSIGPTGLAQVPQSATLLEDGMVLLVSRDGAKLFDPAKRTFTPAGRPLVTRHAHAAIRLNDGRVLIACGGVNVEESKSAEIYDPISDRFAKTGDMLKQFFVCDAALLPDGRVLLTGYSGDSSEEAEIYNPQAGAFSSASKLPFRLADPLSSRLNDGRVLVTSIAFPLYPIRKDGVTAQLYNPPSNSFESIGAILPDRSGFTSTALTDGSVLIAGGGADHHPFYTDTSLLYCP